MIFALAFLTVKTSGQRFGRFRPFGWSPLADGACRHLEHERADIRSCAQGAGIRLLRIYHTAMEQARNKPSMKMARPRPRNEARIGASSRRGASDMIRSVVIPLSGHPHPIVLGERCLRVFRRCSRVMMLCVMMGQSLQRSNGFALAQHRAARRGTAVSAH